MIKDWVDLAELGGEPEWPPGLSYKGAVAELQSRAAAGHCPDVPPAKRSALGADAGDSTSENASSPRPICNNVQTTDQPSAAEKCVQAPATAIPVPAAPRRPGRPMGTSARAGEAQRQAERRAAKAQAASAPPTPAAQLAASAREPQPTLQKTFSAFDDVMRTGASSSSSSLPRAEEITQALNWRQKRKAKDAELKPRSIAEDEDDPNLTPAQRTMARLRRRAAEREMQQHN
jgi:hypothetical protein